MQIGLKTSVQQQQLARQSNRCFLCRIDHPVGSQLVTSRGRPSPMIGRETTTNTFIKPNSAFSASPRLTGFRSSMPLLLPFRSASSVTTTTTTALLLLLTSTPQQLSSSPHLGISSCWAFPASQASTSFLTASVSGVTQQQQLPHSGSSSRSPSTALCLTPHPTITTDSFRTVCSSNSNSNSDVDMSTVVTATTSRSTTTMGVLDAASAAALDADLMASLDVADGGGGGGFTLEQLMELAGLSVAQVTYQIVVEEDPYRSLTVPVPILLICGPGNNGGDGLVAARHLALFGCHCTIVYPKANTKNEHFVKLLHQCRQVGITVTETMPSDLTQYAVIVDAIFGFSFTGIPREPFASILQQMKDVTNSNSSSSSTATTTTTTTSSNYRRPLIIAVDVPSGWDVDEGDVTGHGLQPDVLISLTVPKPCASKLPAHARHFVGGRFLPPSLAAKYKIQMPAYTGSNQIVEVTTTTK